MMDSGTKITNSRTRYLQTRQHRDDDPGAHSLRGRERSSYQECDRNPDGDQQPERYEKEHDVVPKHAPEVSEPGPPAG